MGGVSTSTTVLAPFFLCARIIRIGIEWLEAREKWTVLPVDVLEVQTSHHDFEIDSPMLERRDLGAKGPVVFRVVLVTEGHA